MRNLHLLYIFEIINLKYIYLKPGFGILINDFEIRIRTQIRIFLYLSKLQFLIWVFKDFDI